MKTHLPSFENEDLWCLIKANGEYRLYSTLFSFLQERKSFLVQFHIVSPADKPGNFNQNFNRKRACNKKIMSKSAECMSKALHSMNFSPFRKKISSDLVICLSVCLGKHGWITFEKPNINTKYFMKFADLFLLFCWGGVEEGCGFFRII